eukprot:UN33228
MTKSINKNYTKKVKKTDSEAYTTCRNLIKTYFSTKSVNELIIICISKYFILTKTDMTYWEQNGELYFQETLLETSNEAVRQTCCSLFTILIKKYKANSAELMTNLLMEVIKKGNSNGESVLKREAIYRAFGLAYPIISERLAEKNFNVQEFYTKLLEPDIQSKHTIIVQRVCWLFACFHADIIAVNAMAKRTFQLLSYSLNSQSDIVVRLTVVQTVQKLVSHPGFRSCTLIDECDNILKGVIQLINQLTEVDNITQCITTLGIVIDKMGCNVKKQTNSTFTYIKKLWNENRSNLIRVSIVGVLTSMVKSAEGESCEYYSIIMPILEFVTDSTSQDFYLVEKGYDLWLQVVQNATKLTPKLNKLFERCLTQLADECHTQQCFRLLKSYLLLGKLEFVQTHADKLKTVMNTAGIAYINLENANGAHHICQLVDTFFQLFPKEGPEFIKPLLNHIIMKCIDIRDPTLFREIVQYVNTIARLFL